MISMTISAVMYERITELTFDFATMECAEIGVGVRGSRTYERIERNAEGDARTRRPLRCR